MVVALEMGLRRLLFVSWPVDPAVVAPRLPDALSVDTHDGEGWLSVVVLRGVDVRPRGLPAGIDLCEVNLRTYVTGAGDPGVYFFSLDADALLGVIGARLLHGLPCYYARVRLRGDDRIHVESRRRHPGARPARFVATYGPVNGDPDIDRGLADFLTERYRYYARGADGIRYADIDHERWPLYAAEAAIEENTLFRASGFADPDGEPVCYYSPGTETVIARSRRVR